MEQKKIVISMPLLTHVSKTDNKKTPNKYWKINNQALYSGTLNQFSRAIVVEKLHHYMINSFKSEIFDLKIEKIFSIHYVFYTVRNHGAITRRLGKISWKPVTETYKSNWDLNNISDIWIKTGNDALVLAGVLVDDNTDVIDKTMYQMKVVDHIDDLELEIIITY
jgi:hypothetical protein